MQQTAASTIFDISNVFRHFIKSRLKVFLYLNPQLRWHAFASRAKIEPNSAKSAGACAC
jgi:hypothetical protein